MSSLSKLSVLSQRMKLLLAVILQKTNLSVIQANYGIRANKKKKNTKDEVKSKDIRDMLKKTFLCAL